MAAIDAGMGDEPAWRRTGMGMNWHGEEPAWGRTGIGMNRHKEEPSTYILLIFEQSVHLYISVQQCPFLRQEQLVVTHIP